MFFLIDLAAEDRIRNATQRKRKKAGSCNGILKLLIFQTTFSINVWFREDIQNIFEEAEIFVDIAIVDFEPIAFN